MNHRLGKIFAMGILITTVLAIIAFILIKLYTMVEKLVRPVAQFFRMDTIFGEITIIFFAILTILILVFVLGFISMLPSVFRYKNKMENWLLEIYPSLNYFKMWADEKLKMDSERTNWKPVLALIDDQYWPAFIVEENEEWVTLSVLYIPDSSPMELLIARKNSLQLIPMTMSQMLHNNRRYGKGHLSLIPSASKK